MSDTRRGLEPKDLYNLKQVGDAQVSPDGKLAAYVVQRTDEKEDKSLTDIFLCDLTTMATKRLTNSGKDGSPRFSPDGRRLAFTSGRKEKNQLFILDLAGGEAWHLPTKPAVGSYAWFPDGSSIVFTARVFSHEEEWQPYPGAPDYDGERLKELATKEADKEQEKDKAKLNEVKVITRLSYRRDGAGYHGDKRQQIFVVPVPADTPDSDPEPAERQITSGDFDHSLPAFSPTGRYLVTAARRTDSADYDQKSDFWLWDLKQGESYLFYGGPGPLYGPLWSPDGEYIAFSGHDSSFAVSTETDLWLLPVASWLERLEAGESPEPLTMASAENLTRPFDRPVGGHGGAEPRLYGGDSLFWREKELYFLMSEAGAGGIYRRTDGGQIEPVLVDADLAITGISGAHESLIYTASRPDELEELYLHGETPQAIGKVNDDFMAGIDLGSWDKLTYESEPGVFIDGWLLYPLGYEAGKRYPLLLLVHGGPHGAYGPAFSFSAQIFAAQGYLVLLTNPRGSTTYGQEFTCAIDKNWGVVDYLDINKGLDKLIDEGLADPERLFVHGWSFGGYMTCWLITQTNRFKAACGGANVTNMLSGYGTSDIIFSDEYEYGGQSWKDYVHLMEHSPLGHADKVETPILLLHGELDLRCPMGQSEEFYAALRRMGKEAVLVRYPGEYHGLKRPLHRVDRYERLLAWFNHYLEA